MIRGNNSLAYLMALEGRRKTIFGLKNEAELLDSSYGKFFAYLLLTNINLSVHKEYKIKIPSIPLDAGTNFEAWYKERNPVTGKFRVRREFVPYIRTMLNEVKELLDEEETITDDERAYLVMFCGLVGLYFSGKLLPSEVNKDFTIIKELTHKGS